MQNKLQKVFTGNEIEVILLKGELEENGISALVKDDFSSGIRAGFYGGTPSSIELFIEESDMANAGPIVQQFLEARQTGQPEEII